MNLIIIYVYATKVGNEERKYSKYFIQQDVLKEKYDTVSEAHTDSFFNIEMILGFLYGAYHDFDFFFPSYFWKKLVNCGCYNWSY